MIYEASRKGLLDYLSDRKYFIYGAQDFEDAENKYRFKCEVKFVAAAVGLEELIIWSKIRSCSFLKMNGKGKWNFAMLINGESAELFKNKLEKILNEKQIIVKVQFPENFWEGSVAEKFVNAHNDVADKIQEKFVEKLKQELQKIVKKECE